MSICVFVFVFVEVGAEGCGLGAATPLVFVVWGGGGLDDLGPVGGGFVVVVEGGEMDGRDSARGPEGGGLDDGPRGGERVRIEDFVSRAGERDRERVR